VERVIIKELCSQGAKQAKSTSSGALRMPTFESRLVLFLFMFLVVVFLLIAAKFSSPPYAAVAVEAATAAL